LGYSGGGKKGEISREKRSFLLEGKSQQRRGKAKHFFRTERKTVRGQEESPISLTAIPAHTDKGRDGIRPRRA